MSDRNQEFCHLLRGVRATSRDLGCPLAAICPTAISALPPGMATSGWTLHALHARHGHVPVEDRLGHARSRHSGRVGSSVPARIST